MSTQLETSNRYTPAKTFKLVYLVILVITLVSLVRQLGSTPNIGFMAEIDGRANADTGRGVMIAMFSSWGLFIFSTYLHIEAFEDMDSPFHNLQKPKCRTLVLLEYAIRLFLVGIVTVKLWKPDSYQAALLVMSSLCLLLFFWTILVWKGFQAKWDHADFALLAMAIMGFLIVWLSYNPDREAKFGLLIVVALVLLFIFTISLAGLRTAKAVKATLHSLI